MTRPALDYNEHNLCRRTVNGRTLTTHAGYPSDASAAARRLLAREDGPEEVNVGRHRMTAWFRGDNSINVEPPEGWQIVTVSAFHEDSHSATAITLKRED